MPLLYVSVRPQLGAADAEYASFLEATGLEAADVDRHDVMREALTDAVLDTATGVVVGGSPLTLTDPVGDQPLEQRRVERDLERVASRSLESGLPALFTCYGIGVVTRMLGGVVDRSHPEGTSAALLRSTDAGIADPVTRPLGATFHALTAHKESARETPPGATLLATNDACPVQAYRVGDSLYATQFHPEPTPAAFVARMDFYRGNGYFSVAEYDAVAARVLAAPVETPALMLRAFTARSTRDA